MRLVIRPHSVVDIITNSSTVIYTWAAANAVEMVEDLINEVLSNVTNMTLRADDFYDIEVRVTDNAMESVVDRLLDDGEDEEIAALYEEYTRRKLGWQEKTKKLAEYVRANYSEDDLERISSDPYGYDWMPETEIVVTSKQGIESKIDKILAGLFEHDAIRDG
jgi:hypothetical protein